MRCEFAVTEREDVAADRKDAVARLRAELEESIRLHLVSDVPLGVFLSGGMDSSALVALMSRISDQRPQTFSVVFDEPRLLKRHSLAQSPNDFKLTIARFDLLKTS